MGGAREIQGATRPIHCAAAACRVITVALSGLLAQTEAIDQGLVALEVGALQVIEQLVAAAPAGLARVYTVGHAFIGLADAEAGRLVPRRLIATQEAGAAQQA